MNVIIFIKGFAVGFIICAPFGPIGIMCLRRALVEGPIAGLFSFLGASTADALYCSIAGLGVSYISNFLRDAQEMLKVLGGLILILWGFRMWFSRPREKRSRPDGNGLIAAYTSAFFLTLTNLVPILVFSAAFAALGIQGWKTEHVSTSMLVLGVFCGSAIWAPVLVTVIGLFRLQFSLEQIRLINKVSGSIIIGFGVVAELVTLIG